VSGDTEFPAVGFPGDSAFLTACLNGGTSRAEHPAVPYSPEELAAEARSAVASGARAIHVHPRSVHGEQSLEPSDVLPAVAAIRAATGLPVGVTTGIWTVSGDVSQRLALVAGWTGPDKPDFASINVNEPGIDDLADLGCRCWLRHPGWLGGHDSPAGWGGGSRKRRPRGGGNAAGGRSRPLREALAHGPSPELAPLARRR
jgi:uncharacterized protein (DUF849 family)